MSKVYKIPVVWTMCDTLIITAGSYEEACEKARSMPLTPGEYLETSFEIDEYSVECFNPEYLKENTNQNI